MKIVSVAQMRDLESQAFRQGASEENFMENAGKEIAKATEAFIQKHGLSKQVLLLCAKGNNSGDAYVAGRYLLQKGYKVIALQTVPIHTASALCVKNHQRFLLAGGQAVDSLPLFPKQGIIIDGLFGTGFKGALREPFMHVVQQANKSGLPIISIDIPSGLNGDTGVVEGGVIQATTTLYLGAPKKGFFMNDGWNTVGLLEKIYFGLPNKFLDSLPDDMILLTDSFIQSLLPPIKRNWHKYERGYVTGIAGSLDMPGASILSSWAALKAGAGIVRLIHPEGMNAELSAAPLELVRQTYSLTDLEPVIESVNKSTATFIGPGIGRSSEAYTLLKYILNHSKTPCVVDADALTLLAEFPLKLPENAVLTPHHGEMLRLLGKVKEPLTTEELLDLSQKFVNFHKITLVLKGAPTFILHPYLPMYVNPRGDPGMATAGTGDVLTGIIAAFLSHRIPAHQAALLGVYVHAWAGEKAAAERTSYSMLASDLIEYLPEVFKEFLPLAK